MTRLVIVPFLAGTTVGVLAGAVGVIAWAVHTTYIAGDLP